MRLRKLGAMTATFAVALGAFSLATPALADDPQEIPAATEAASTTETAAPAQTAPADNAVPTPTPSAPAAPAETPAASTEAPAPQAPAETPAASNEATPANTPVESAPSPAESAPAVTTPAASTPAPSTPSPAPAPTVAGPKVPTLTLTGATCERKENTVTLGALDDVAKDTASGGYRFVVIVDGRAVKQLNGSERSALYAGTISAERLIDPSMLNMLYGKTVTIKAYWFDKANVYFTSSDQRKNGTPEHLTRGTVALMSGSLTKAIELTTSNTITLVNPTTLDCTPTVTEQPATPADPATSEDPALPAPTLPDAPSIALTPAQCVDNEAQLNLITLDPAQKQDNYRFVVSMGGQSVQLKTAIRDALWTEGTLSLEELVEAFAPADTSIPYGSEVSVQAYWFDKAGVYPSSTYDTTLQLTAGNSDRFVKLGQAHKATIVDPDSLKCAPTTPSAPDTPTHPSNPATPALPQAPAFTLASASCAAKGNVLSVTPGSLTNGHRFVVSYGNYAISLKESIRTALNHTGSLSLEEALKTFYPLNTTPIPYGEQVSVQAYWFDQAKEYPASAYDTTLKLTVGKSDQFIKLGESKSATLVDPATVCDDDANLTLSVPETEHDGWVTFTATGFKPFEDVTFEVHSDPITVGTVKADANGVATIRWQASADTVDAGKHTVYAKGKESGTVVSAPLEVKAKVSDQATTLVSAPTGKDAPTGTANAARSAKPGATKSGLAKTGVDSNALLIGILVAVGAVATTISRRRTSN
ncbi:hypothetical protein [Schaalia suimastitidis]|uniref:hypothetical protein n=1 Tax=Schaalia suimastitidis TaxID=121163 RepID=UPI00040BC550|nr:hypothetical protein [Schaalia suimastitidis]